MRERFNRHLTKLDVFNAGGRLVYGDNYEQLYAQVLDGQCLAGLTNLDGVTAPARLL
jgi:hypothetical protein